MPSHTVGTVWSMQIYIEANFYRLHPFITANLSQDLGQLVPSGTSYFVAVYRTPEARNNARTLGETQN
jgi:hypothetical protein